MNFQRNNHYVPCLYLKRFATSPGCVLTYRTMVTDQRVRVWQKRTIKGIAYYSNLYTRIVGATETDDLEKWLNSEFESPAEEALSKATTGSRMTPDDWRKLVRFLAAQDLRTPARLLENMQFWRQNLPSLLDKSLEKSVQQLEQAKQEGRTTPSEKMPNSEYIPLRVTTIPDPGLKLATVKSELLVGRGLWFFTMRHALTKTADILHSHKWTILLPPSGYTWFTTDDPVVRLNYYADGTYDFKGGWGNNGAEIFLPLSPNHLLYTKIGARPPARPRLRHTSSNG